MSVKRPKGTNPVSGGNCSLLKMTVGLRGRFCSVPGYLGLTPTVNATETLRPDISVRMSAAFGALDFVDAGLMPVMAWLSVRLLSASRTLDFASLDDPRTV